MLVDVFENFQNMCLKVCELDPAHFLFAPGLACQAALKKTKEKLDLLTDINMLLMVEKVAETEYVKPFINMWKLIINTRKIIITKSHHILSIGT